MLIENEITVAQLIAAYAKGQRVFEKIELVGGPEGASLLGIDLQDAEFSDCWFHSARFSQVNLQRVKFRGCNLKCASFEQCDLRASVWEVCTVCSLAIADSDVANIQASRLDAYGAEIGSAEAFLDYAQGNGREMGQDASEADLSITPGSKSAPASFLNVDLELESSVDLAPLAEELADRVFVLYCGLVPAGFWLSVEPVTEGSLGSRPDACTEHFLNILETLSPDGAALLKSCNSRVFDYGFDGGLEANPMQTHLKCALLARMAALGIDLRITTYPYRAAEPEVCS